MCIKPIPSHLLPWKLLGACISACLRTDKTRMLHRRHIPSWRHSLVLQSFATHEYTSKLFWPVDCSCSVMANTWWFREFHPDRRQELQEHNETSDAGVWSHGGHSICTFLWLNVWNCLEAAFDANNIRSLHNHTSHMEPFPLRLPVFIQALSHSSSLRCSHTFQLFISSSVQPSLFTSNL